MYVLASESSRTYVNIAASWQVSWRLLVVASVVCDELQRRALCKEGFRLGN
jgi:DNA-binding transcriptional regulator PaaX